MRARTLSAALVLGCGFAPADDGDEPASGDSSSDATDSPGPAGNTTGYQEPEPCDSSQDCGDGFCVAPYDAGAPTPIGKPVCVSACVEEGASKLYCVDTPGCCAPLVCDPNGLCVTPEEDDETDTGSDGTETGASTSGG